ncbi:MAG: type II toxin-antitoxin system VapC family toxin [Desulfamplus sp.]|nr:type II toxin-antitoxin system VapC family toxin [Desulfamplus sp.]
MMFILDTDHISLFQRNNPDVVSRIIKTPPDKLATTIITFEEQIRGRLDIVRKAKTDEGIIRAYENLSSTLSFFKSIKIISFDLKSQKIFKSLREQKLRIGTQDLRIASIGISYNAVIVTRNYKDFKIIPSLEIEDWSTESA